MSERSPEKDDPALLLSEKDRRRDLLETLDRLVFLENQYRSSHGHITQILSRLGYPIPEKIARRYDIRVARVGSSGFQISAFSELDGKTVDRAWVDDQFHLSTNFPVPTPRVEYLKQRAVHQLRALSEENSLESAKEDGIFTGYFRYEIRRDSENRAVPVAIGIQPPVTGLQLETSEKKTLLGERSQIQQSGAEGTDLSIRAELSGMERYAKEWADFARMTPASGSDLKRASENRRIASVPDSTRSSASSETQDPSDHLVIESLESLESRSD